MVTCKTIRASVPEPCPRRVRDGDCVACRVSFEERAAMHEHLAWFSRVQAEDMATRAALASLPGHRNLLG